MFGRSADTYRVMRQIRGGLSSEPPDASDRRARFELLYEECRAAVLGYVLRRCENSDDAADAIAETFLIAWRRLDEVPDGEGRRLWLYGTARRVLANQRRGDRRRLALNQRLRTELIQRPGVPEPGSTLAEVSDAFGQLSDADREVLALEGWEGLTPAQIAAVLGCSANAARIRLHRAHRRLAGQLAEQQADRGTVDPRVLRGETA